jgi:hypothetical protein
MFRRASLVLATVLLCGALPPADVDPKGPHELPERLEGLWKVSLCISGPHSWIRLEHTGTGEVHTLSRYKQGVGGIRNVTTGEQVWPAAAVSGVQWDLDMQYEDEFRQGKYRLLRVLVENPPIYRGRDDGFGYYLLRNNCTTYARDAWHYYSGEGYPLPVVHTPEHLLVGVLKRHPESESIARAASHATPPQ